MYITMVTMLPTSLMLFFLISLFAKYALLASLLLRNLLFNLSTSCLLVSSSDRSTLVTVFEVLSLDTLRGLPRCERMADLVKRREDCFESCVCDVVPIVNDTDDASIDWAAGVIQEYPPASERK